MLFWKVELVISSLYLGFILIFYSVCLSVESMIWVSVFVLFIFNFCCKFKCSVNVAILSWYLGLLFFFFNLVAFVGENDDLRLLLYFFFRDYLRSFGDM